MQGGFLLFLLVPSASHPSFEKLPLSVFVLTFIFPRVFAFVSLSLFPFLGLSVSFYNSTTACSSSPSLCMMCTHMGCYPCFTTFILVLNITRIAMSLSYTHFLRKLYYDDDDNDDDDDDALSRARSLFVLDLLV
jgi:hypothetical protein